MVIANAQAQANPNIQKQLKNQHLYTSTQQQLPSEQVLLANLSGTDGMESQKHYQSTQNKTISDHMNEIKR